MLVPRPDPTRPDPTRPAGVEPRGDISECALTKILGDIMGLREWGHDSGRGGGRRGAARGGAGR